MKQELRGVNMKKFHVKDFSKGRRHVSYVILSPVAECSK